MMRYKVLWFDDNFRKHIKIDESAYQNGIDLIGYDNSKDGILHLQENFNKYHAILLDGRFYSSAEQKGSDTLTDKALGEVLTALTRLEHKRSIPYFILSGNSDFLDGDNSLLSGLANNKKVYKKIDSDYVELWHQLKSEADQEEVNKIRQSYSNVFEVFEHNLLDESYEEQLLNLIKTADENDLNSSKNSFNNIRRILEALFSKLNKLGIIPDEIMYASQWFNPSSRFLCDVHENYAFKEEIISPAIKFQLKNLVQICQDASHELKDKLTIAVIDHMSCNKSNYLFKSALFMLFDILIYFDGFTKGYSKKQKNLELWEEKWILGKVLNVADNGYGTFSSEKLNSTISIPPFLMKEHVLKQDDTIKIKINKENKITEINRIAN